jgi:trk system potassium uptake protein TrkA
MKIMIIGGGNVGFYLTKSLLADKHQIMIVEENPLHCERLVSGLRSKWVQVTQGDGTDVDCLREAGIFDTDVFIAVTGYDQNNLVACQLAKDYFGVKKTISRVKNPKNIRVFEKLGVDSVISSTERIAGIINQELEWDDVNKILREHSSTARLREFNIEQKSWLVDHPLKDLGIPKGIIIIAILRGAQVIVPGGETLLQQEDTIILWGEEGILHDFLIEQALG